MKKRYSIGETSNIVGISIDRLRNYDKINLIKPAYVDEKTGYRYYIGDQFRRLRFIKYLILYSFLHINIYLFSPWVK